jgi:hypothetical protein
VERPVRLREHPAHRPERRAPRAAPAARRRRVSRPRRSRRPSRQAVVADRKHGAAVRVAAAPVVRHLLSDKPAVKVCQRSHSCHEPHYCYAVQRRLANPMCSLLVSGEPGFTANLD